jgi:hypothetical protein
LAFITPDRNFPEEPLFAPFWATCMEARTFFLRLLEVQPATGVFTRNEGHPLETDLLVVDETSMG